MVPGGCKVPIPPNAPQWHSDSWDLRGKDILLSKINSYDWIYLGKHTSNSDACQLPYQLERPDFWIWWDAYEFLLICPKKPQSNLSGGWQSQLFDLPKNRPKSKRLIKDVGKTRPSTGACPNFILACLREYGQNWRDKGIMWHCSWNGDLAAHEVTSQTCRWQPALQLHNTFFLLLSPSLVFCAVFEKRAPRLGKDMHHHWPRNKHTFAQPIFSKGMLLWKTSTAYFSMFPIFCLLWCLYFKLKHLKCFDALNWKIDWIKTGEFRAMV